MHEPQVRAPSTTHFFSPFGDASLHPLTGPWSGIASLEPLSAVFKQNVRAANDMMGFPFLLTVSSLHQLRFEQEFRVRLIRGLLPQNQIPGETKDQQRTRIQSELAGEATEWPMPSQTALDNLEHMYDHDLDMVGNAAAELLRQGTVLLWSAFEVLANDLFKKLLNVNASLIQRLLADDGARKLFDTKLSLEKLAKHNFNASSSMGELLLEDRTLDNVFAIKTAFRALCSADLGLRAALDNRDLFVLNQRRHLIVHRRGIVDADYAGLAKDGAKPGDTLVMTALQLEEALQLVLKSGGSLLTAAVAILA